jgi:D-alanyl-lipoteichoic acid acyltransferase DltB (MBOAT superfamily)
MESPWVQKIALILELALLCLVVEQTRIVSPAFVRIFWIIAGGVLIHEVLPTRLRPAGFLALSWLCTAAILRPVPTLVLIGVVLAFIGVCQLRIRLRFRVLILLVMALLLAAYRLEADWLPMPSMDVLIVGPIVASMLMFRLSIYLYDRENAKGPLPVVQTLNYFFMVPNVCFLLFPVVDYTTFLKSCRDEQRWRIQQEGVRWILVGISHLLLVRLVDLHLVRDPDHLKTWLDHVLYVMSAYLLYLRVSGQFHLVVGVLHLFGYGLPRTNNKYFLASSFTDLWRRINIYWMEYMRKLIYYPMLLRLRTWGPVRASVVATLCVFVATIVLHAYQYFWLSGSFRVSPRDLLFWGLLCGLVMIDMYRERKRMDQRRGRLASSPPEGPRFGLASVIGTVTTFGIMTILWSLWSSESISLGEWFAILGRVVMP